MHSYVVISKANQREFDTLTYPEPKTSAQVLRDFFTFRNCSGMNPMIFGVKAL